MPGALSSRDIEAKVLEYETFVNEKLKKDLQRVLDQRAAHQQELQEWEDLRQHVQLLQQRQECQQPAAAAAAAAATAATGSAPAQSAAAAQSPPAPLKTRMDLGCGVYCQAVVPDSSKICISVGLGFHVEANLDEALSIISLQQQKLQAKVTASVQQAAELKAHIKFVVEAIGQLVGM